MLVHHHVTSPINSTLDQFSAVNIRGTSLLCSFVEWQRPAESFPNLKFSTKFLLANQNSAHQVSVRARRVGTFGLHYIKKVFKLCSS
jgi:hypothetical protein